MGWTSYQCWNYNDHGKIDRKGECDRYFELWDGHEVVKSTMVGTVYYAAVKTVDTDEVWAAVFLTHVDGDEFAYKDMDETVVPCYYDCPNSILKLLTPTDNKWANQWREKCRKNNAHKNSPKAFSRLIEGQRVLWTVPDDRFVGLNKGDKVYMTKAKVNGMKRCIWLIEGMGYVSPKHINHDDYKLV